MNDEKTTFISTFVLLKVGGKNSDLYRSKLKFLLVMQTTDALGYKAEEGRT